MKNLFLLCLICFAPTSFAYNAYECDLTQHISIHKNPVLCIQKQVETSGIFKNLGLQCEKVFHIYAKDTDGKLHQLTTKPTLFEESVELGRKLTRNCTCSRLDLDFNSLFNPCD